MLLSAGSRRPLSSPPASARKTDGQSTTCTWLFPPSPEIPRLLDLLHRLCDESGRDYDAIEKTAPFAFDVRPDGSKAGELAETLLAFCAAGVRA